MFGVCFPRSYHSRAAIKYERGRNAPEKIEIGLRKPRPTEHLAAAPGHHGRPPRGSQVSPRTSLGMF